jgi:hypothetical protein
MTYGPIETLYLKRFLDVTRVSGGNISPYLYAQEEILSLNLLLWMSEIKSLSRSLGIRKMQGMQPWLKVFDPATMVMSSIPILVKLPNLPLHF